MSEKIVIGEVRFSYCNLFVPKEGVMGGEPKYSTTILVLKADVKSKQMIDNAIAEAIREGVEKKWAGVRPPIVPTPLHDGDGVRPSDGMPYGDECKGHWVFTCTTKDAPGVVGPDRSPVINQSDVYSGMYGYVSVNFYPYNFNGKKGVGCGLNHVMKTGDGEPLSGKASADIDFAGVQVPQSYKEPKIDPITGAIIY